VELAWKGIPAPLVEGAFGEPVEVDDCWTVCVAIVFVLLFVSRRFEDLWWTFVELVFLFAVNRCQ
jgi:hypothetical protein